MNHEPLRWVIKTVRDWRKEAGILRKIDDESLLEALGHIQAAGVQEGLAVYVILGCEWLFRIRKVSKDEIDRMLEEIEDGFSKIMEPHLAYWIIEAIGPTIRKFLEREGRVMVSLGLYVTDLSLHPSLKGLFYPEGYKRTPPKRILPPKPGRVPWPAPWIAGCMVAQLLQEKGPGRPGLPIDLVSALLDREIEPRDFRRIKKALAGEALTQLVSDYHRSFNQLLRDAGSAEWWRALRSDLLIRKPGVVFPGDLELVQDLLASYRSSPRKEK